MTTMSPFDQGAYHVLFFFILYDLRTRKRQGGRAQKNQYIVGQNIKSVRISRRNPTSLLASDSNSDPPLILLFRTVCDTVALFLFVSEIVGAYVRHKGKIHSPCVGGEGGGRAPCDSLRNVIHPNIKREKAENANQAIADGNANSFAHDWCPSDSYMNRTIITS